MTSKLSINDLSLNLHLGVTPQEREKKQKVLLNLGIIFLSLPSACTTDKPEDCICYDALIQSIRNFCDKKEFLLIEYLCYQLYQFIKDNISKECKLDLTIEKKPPIAQIKSCSFRIQDN